MPKHRVPLERKDAPMSSINAITVENLARLAGTPRCPVLIDYWRSKKHGT